jgi:UDP-glucuronate decarboxylase
MFDAQHSVVREDVDAILGQPLPWQELAGKHVLVTGATGMIGSYLTLVLLRLCRDLSPAPQLSLLVRSREGARRRFGALLDAPRCIVVEASLLAPPVLAAGLPDVIVHAASPASPKDYAQQPVEVIRANALGTYMLLEHYARDRAPRFLLLSSAVYGATENAGAVDEDSFGAIPTLDPRNCYIESKRMAENLLACWQAQYGLDFKAGRIFHTFGPGLNLDDGRIFADVLKAAVGRAPIVLTSDGLTLRTFCYLADTVAALFYALLRGQPGAAYNIGNSRNELTIREFALLGAQLTDPPLAVTFGEADRSRYLPAPTRRGHPDTTRIEALGWQPRHGVPDALERTYRSLLS